MKSVLISIQPKWCELIASGKKTIEVRKTRPKIETPFKVYIYRTKDKRWLTHWGKNEEFCGLKSDKFQVVRKWSKSDGKVIGEFVCKSIANYEAELWDDETYERIQEFFEPDDFAEYGEYEYKTVADNGDDFWRDNMLCHYSCLTIEELRKYIGSGINEFYGWNISDLVIYDKPKKLSEFSRACNGDCQHCEYAIWETRGYNDPIIVDCKTIRPPQSWCYVEGVEGE